MIKPSQTTTGTVLFALDALLLLLVWPAVLWASQPRRWTSWTCRSTRAASAYPLFDLLLLFAMGLYRRDAILQTGRSCHASRWSWAWERHWSSCSPGLQPWLMPAAAPPSGRGQMVMFSLAVVTFTLCAFAARLVIDVCWCAAMSCAAAC